jgi:hypothetical protein
LTDFKFLFLGELGTCPQNLISTGCMEPWQKHHNFAQRGMLKFIYKGRFLTIKKAYEKFLDWKSKQWAHALVPPLHMEVFFFFLKKTKTSIFGGILKFLELIVFGQILAVLGRFCYIGNGWQHAQTSPKILKTS